jgi:hypothetical protein
LLVQFSCDTTKHFESDAKLYTCHLHTSACVSSSGLLQQLGCPCHTLYKTNCNKCIVAAIDLSRDTKTVARRNRIPARTLSTEVAQNMRSEIVRSPQQSKVHLLRLCMRVLSQAALQTSRTRAGLNVLLISRSESKLKTAAEEIAAAFGVKVRTAPPKTSPCILLMCCARVATKLQAVRIISRGCTVTGQRQPCHRCDGMLAQNCAEALE